MSGEYRWNFSAALPSLTGGNAAEPLTTHCNLSQPDIPSGGLLVTNCLSLYLPEKINEDAVLLIRIGYHDGFNISTNLGLGDP